MKQLLSVVALLLMGFTLAHSQTPYAPNERVILLHDPTQRDAYVTQARKLLASSGKPTILQSTYNPSLLLIRATNVSQLDDPASSLNRLGKSFPNWIEKDRSRRPDSLYCTNCGDKAAAKHAGLKRGRDPVGRFSQGRRTAIADSSTCCPEKNSSRQSRVSVIYAKGTGKVTIAELLEEASRVTADRNVDVVRFTSIFPPAASALLNAFGQQLTERTNAVLRPTNSTKQ